MIKRRYLTAAAFLALLILVPGSAVAHEVQISGNIGALLHVEPDDHAVIGQPAIFTLIFRDKTKKFKPELCDCKITVTDSSGAVIFSQDAFANSQSKTSQLKAVVVHAFDRIGKYNLEAKGKPKVAHPGAFDDFDLDYDIQIYKPGFSLAIFNNHALFSGLLLLIFPAFWVAGYFLEKRNHPQNLN